MAVSAQKTLSVAEQVRRADADRLTRYLHHYRGVRTGVSLKPTGQRRKLAGPTTGQVTKAAKKPNVAHAIARGARGRVFVADDGTTAVRSRTGGWAVKPKSVATIRDGKTVVSRTVSGGGLTDAGKATVAAGGLGAAYGGKKVHDRFYQRRGPRTRTVKVKVKKGLEMSSMSAFGVDHGGEVSKAMAGFGAAKVGAKKIGQGQFTGGAKAIGVGGQQAGRAGIKALKPIGAKTQNTWNKMGTGAKIGTLGGGGLAAGGAAGYGINRRNRNRGF